MKINETLSGQLAKIWMFLMMGVSMSANAGLFGFGGTNWKEEVLLHDGSKIMVERMISRGGRHEIGQQPPVETEWLSLKLPNNGRSIEWRTESSKEVGSAELAPLLLDIHQGTPYLVTVPVGCLAYNKWTRPNPPYIVFRHDGKNWQRIPLQELPSEIRTPNLIFSSPDNEIERLGTKIVSAETVKGIFKRYKQPEFKTILREPIVKKGPEGCPEMIYNGHGGWNSVDIFKSQPSIEACKQFCKLEKMTNQICPCDSIFSRK